MSDAARKLKTADELSATLGQLSFFEQFPDDLLKELGKLTQVVKFESGAKILTQSEVNSNLYFIISGKVGVYVDGRLVTYLARKGDVIGEMSVMTSSPCGATIVAETPVELFAVNA